MMKRYLISTLCFALISLGAQANNPPVPSPQQQQYENGINSQKRLQQQMQQSQQLQQQRMNQDIQQRSREQQQQLQRQMQQNQQRTQQSTPPRSY